MPPMDIHLATAEDSVERLVPGAHPAVLLRTPEAGAGRSILDPGKQLLFEAEIG